MTATRANNATKSHVVRLLLRIREAAGSNLGLEMGYSEVYRRSSAPPHVLGCLKVGHDVSHMHPLQIHNSQFEVTLPLEAT